MRIVQFTTDNREHFKQYDRPEPYFGTAPAGLLAGFAEFPEVEVHVISCTRATTPAPAKIGENIWFHQPLVGKWGWGRTLFLGCVRATRKLVAEIQPDIVHGQGSERDCAMSAVLSGRPNVLTLHGNMRVHAKRGENAGNSYYRMAAALEGFCLGRTDGVVAISEYTRDLVASDTRRTWLVPNAVDKRFFEVTPAPEPVPRLLFVGTLDPRKNPIGLLEACEPLLREGRCTISFAGNTRPDSDYARAFEAMAKSLPGVEMLGFLDRDSLAAVFARTSIVVLPTFEDNCPMVVLEGMAAGLPVAASRVGGVPDLIDDGQTGLLFDPNNPAGMRSAIELLVSDESLRNSLGTASRLSALKRFHPRAIASRHLEIYQEVLAKRG